MTGSTGAASSVLFIEDMAADRDLFLLAFKEVGVEDEVTVIESGEDALEYLEQVSSVRDSDEYPRPRLVLLDLGLPGINGRDVLVQIKDDPALRTIPVVVLTMSESPLDIEQCYRLGANDFVTKPVHYAAVVDVVRSLRERWLLPN